MSRKTPSPPPVESAVAGEADAKPQKTKRLVFAPWDPDATVDGEPNVNHAFMILRQAVLGSGRKPQSASDWAHARRLIDAFAALEGKRKVADERPGREGRDLLIQDLKVRGGALVLGTGEYELLREMWKSLKPTLELAAARSVHLADRIFKALATSEEVRVDPAFMLARGDDD